MQDTHVIFFRSHPSVILPTEKSVYANWKLAGDYSWSNFHSQIFWYLTYQFLIHQNFWIFSCNIRSAYNIYDSPISRWSFLNYLWALGKNVIQSMTILVGTWIEKIGFDKIFTLLKHYHLCLHWLYLACVTAVSDSSSFLSKKVYLHYE